MLPKFASCFATPGSATVPHSLTRRTFPRDLSKSYRHSTPTLCSSAAAEEGDVGGQRDAGGGHHRGHVHDPRLHPPLLRQERVVRPALQKYDGKIEFKGKKVQPVLCVNFV